MLRFLRSADPHSLDIIRVPIYSNPIKNGSYIGYLQWHPDRERRIVLRDSGSNLLNELSLSELKQCVENLNQPTPTEN